MAGSASTRTSAAGKAVGVGPPRAGGAKGGAKAARLDARGVAALLEAASQASDPVCVIAGPERALARAVAGRLLANAPEGAVTVRISAAAATAAETIGAASQPSLFGEVTVLHVTDVELAGDDALAALKAALPSAGNDLRMVLEHSGAARGRALVGAAEQAGGRAFVVRPVAASALPAVLTGHAGQFGRALASDAARAIIDAAGQDLSVLLAVVEQLASDAPGDLIDRALVRDTLSSTGSDNQFEIADLVWRRQQARALESFRSLVEREGASAACITVAAALSYSLRPLAKYVADRPTGNQWQIAAALGVPAWKVDALAAQAGLWRPGQLAEATVLLAAADAAAKGGLGDAGALDTEQKLLAIEQLISRLAGS